MSALAHALLAELDEDTLNALADRLAPRLASRLASPPTPDGWIDAKSAAAYLSISRHALHKLTAARAIPFEQDAPGCKLWFKRSDLDAWRRGDCNGHRKPARTSASKSLPNGDFATYGLELRPNTNRA
jgi:excisionase family DNA binding protein